LAERRARGNILETPAESFGAELVELVGGGEGVAIERIVSTGQATPAGEWLQQDRDEWVVLVEGEAELAYVIPAGERHRVEWTRRDPPCIWLAVHAAGLTHGRRP
jgi:cupin 2 domain-containing protein